MSPAISFDIPIECSDSPLMVWVFSIPSSLSFGAALEYRFRTEFFLTHGHSVVHTSWLSLGMPQNTSWPLLLAPNLKGAKLSLLKPNLLTISFKDSI